VVAIVNVDGAEPFAAGVTDAGLRVQVVFAGQPVTVSATELLNPPTELTVIVEFPALPCVSVTDAGLADSEKSGIGAPQPENLNDPIRVNQPYGCVVGKYSLMYQKVQSSLGSICMEV